MDRRPPDTAGTGRPVRRRRRIWPWVVGVLLLLAVYGAVSGLRLAHAVRQLRAGVDATQRVRAELTVADLTSGRSTADLSAAAADFAAARQTVTSSWMSPLTVLPWAGRQFRSVRALSVAAAQVTGAGDRSLAQVRQLLDAPRQRASDRAALVGRLADTLTALDRQVTGVSLGPSDALLGTLAAKRATFAEDLGKLRAGLDRASAASTALSGLLEGPKTYLVLASNNAEMRAGSGMFLQVGTVTFDHGAVTVGAFQPSAELSPNQPPVPVNGDLGARWGQQQPGSEWRNLALSPQFGLNAPVAARMWQARSGQRVDGVLSVDDAALADVLDVTGPVTVAGTTYSGATAEQQLLVDQYRGLASDDVANAARHESQGLLAATALQRIESPGLSVSALAAKLDQAANGRHILAWASDPATEAAWQGAGVGGDLAADDLLVGVMNQGANKLDPFQAVTATLGIAPASRTTQVTVAVHLHNAAPGDLSAYAGDGTPGPRLAYNGTMALDLPKRAGHITRDGSAPVVAAGSDGTSTVLAQSFSVPVGGDITMTWRFELLGAHGHLRVDPSARLPPIEWTLPAGTFSDAAAHQVSW